MIEESRKTNDTEKKKKILFLVNHEIAIYNCRLELVEKLLNDGHEVHISSPYGKRLKEIENLGAIIHNITIERHGKNPIREVRLFHSYHKLYSAIKPDIIFGYTIKPNIYGAMVAGRKNIPFVANITGLGTVFESTGILQKITIMLYKLSFRKIQRVFFQNRENQLFFRKKNIAVKKGALLPGSGVNLNKFTVKEYPRDQIIKFAFISRIMKEKGIEQYLYAAKEIKRKYKNTEFHICGFCESDYKGELNKYISNGIVIYHGMINDVAKFMSQMNCIIHPTYYPEGLSNVLLESCACGRPIITTNRPGCKEVIDNEINGYLVKEKDNQDLIEKIELFLRKNSAECAQMGLSGRKKVETEFNREIVIKKYLDELKKI